MKGILFLIPVAALVTSFTFCKAPSKIAGNAKSVKGTWEFSITTTDGNGSNKLVFSGEETSGTFKDQYGHGGPWTLDTKTDSIHWEYKTGETLPAGLINKISGKLNADYSSIIAKSSGVYNGKAFTGEWKGSKN